MNTGHSAVEPRVSVVIPMHNAQDFIAAAMRSALDPSFPEVEVLVVDDGSTDGSLAAARAVADPRVQLLESSASGGPSRPRNIGIARARAPYVSLLDADDQLKPGKLAASFAALEHNPAAGFAFGDFEKIDADGNLFELSVMHAYPRFRALALPAAGDDWRLVPQRLLARALLYENFIGTSGVVVRTALVREVGGFDESLANSNDRDLWFRLAHLRDALYSPRVGHCYRVHARSVMHGPPIRNALSRIEVLRREKARWRDTQARRQLNHLIATNYAAVGYRSRETRRRWAAAGSFLRAFAASREARWLVAAVGSALFGAEIEMGTP
jgi:glycosyltransferase involved in cell wall biosynthesis